MYIDLHVHSIFSDSSRSPEEVVAVAKERHVSYLSICDHSSVSAYPRFIAACEQTSMNYTIGVEVDGTMYGENYHVLAYNFDTGNKNMLEFIQYQKNKSDNECEDMVARMSKDYSVVSVEDYRHYKSPREKGGWKYIYYAVAKGLFSSYEEAEKYIFPKYFVGDSRTYPIEDFCDLVKKAGGVPVLAHPGYIYRRAPEAFLSFLGDIYERGIEGLECYYPSHGEDVTKLCLEFCKKNDLRITAGSDCHGEYDNSPGFTIGSLKITPDMLDLKGIIK